MSHGFIPPAGCTNVKVVGSFDELVKTPFHGEVNALCWARALTGDFCEVVRQIETQGDITTLDEASLRGLALSAPGRAAVDTLLSDLQKLRSVGLSPILDCIQKYPRDEDAEIISTDVYSFHVDSATAPTDTYLCSYTEASSEAVRNEEARCCVNIPEIRAELLKRFGGRDDDAFNEHLTEMCYDLHYVAEPEARPFLFGLGNLWRIAVKYPGSPVLPCVHRAPATLPGRPPRLLLIS